MAKAYFIGGAPRVGKTTLTINCLGQKPMMAASTDAIRYTLRRLLEREKYPDLFHVGKYTSNDLQARQKLLENPEEVIAEQNRESEIVWESTVNFVASNLEDGLDVLIEGMAVLPKLLHESSFDNSVVFLGNQSKEHYETVLVAAKSNPKDWMRDLEDEAIKAFCSFIQNFSKYIESQAEEYQCRMLKLVTKCSTSQ